MALARSLGRAGIETTGIAAGEADFGFHTRFLTRRFHITAKQAESDRQVMAALRESASDGRPVLFPDNDNGVDFVLRHWEQITEIADLPLPGNPDVVRRLQRKERLPLEAEKAGVPAPRTAFASSEEDVRAATLSPPFLVKPVEGKNLVAILDRKAFLVHDRDEALAAWLTAKKYKVETILQELVPDCQDRIYSLFTYISRDGEPLASVVGRKVRQLPTDFGSSTIFRVEWHPRPLELGLQLLRSAGYTGFAHIEFAHDLRDDDFKLIEVNTRIPVWASIAMHDRFDMALVAYDDLCGLRPTQAEPFKDPIYWVDLSRDITHFVRERDTGLRDAIRPYFQRRKARAFFAPDDPIPAVLCARQKAGRVLTKLSGRAGSVSPRSET